VIVGGVVESLSISRDSLFETVPEQRRVEKEPIETVDAAGVIEEAKPENVKAWLEDIREYGIYH